MSSLILGVLLAVLASACNNLGLVLQKKVVNEVPPEKRDKGFYRTIMMRPLWIAGIVMQIGLSTAFLLSAQYFIGPTLTPGIMASGLVILVIGSILINHERIKAREILGIVLLMAATAMIGASGLEIEIRHVDFNHSGLLERAMLFTAIIAAISIGLELIQRKAHASTKGVLLTFLVGCLYVMSDFWMSPLVGTIGSSLSFKASLREGILFVTACGALVLTNIFAIGKTQAAFKYGRASILVPLRHIPTLVAPVFVYLWVYALRPGKAHSLPVFLAGAGIVLVSLFLLGGAGEETGQAEDSDKPNS
jgi:drug/metabolite transporter (DMT)-like permease